jgi:uncharacterized protein YqjF (DUF2071 family)
MAGKFLEAEWRKLVIFNFEVEPSILHKYLPAGVELDDYNGKYFLSLVGFKFLNTKVWGIKWPGHKNFLEVNLRFYVKRSVNGELRRGVVFIREIVTKRLITFIANSLYNENYKSMGLEDEIRKLGDEQSVKYAILKKGQHIFGVQAETNAWAFKQGSIEEFITEHYWGYAAINHNKSNEYRVDHPVWSCYPVKYFFLKIDFGEIYGEEFKFLNKAKPHSVLLAEGSEVSVFKAQTLKKI